MYRITESNKGGIFTKSYKRFKNAIDYFDTRTEFAKRSWNCTAKYTTNVQFHRDGIKIMEWNQGEFEWFNLCPKCGKFNTERTLRLCCF